MGEYIGNSEPGNTDRLIRAGGIEIPEPTSFDDIPAGKIAVSVLLLTTPEGEVVHEAACLVPNEEQFELSRKSRRPTRWLLLDVDRALMIASPHQREYLHAALEGDCNCGEFSDVEDSHKASEHGFLRRYYRKPGPFNVTAALRRLAAGPEPANQPTEFDLAELINAARIVVTRSTSSDGRLCTSCHERHQSCAYKGSCAMGRLRSAVQSFAAVPS